MLNSSFKKLRRANRFAARSTVYIHIYISDFIHSKFEINLSYQYVCSISEELPDYSYVAERRWFTIKDEKYDSWAYYWGDEYSEIEQYLKENVQDFDTSKYTYIVVYEYSLDSLSYSFGRMFNAYTQFVGKANLVNHEKGIFNVYRVKKMNIDSVFKPYSVFYTYIDGEPLKSCAGS